MKAIVYSKYGPPEVLRLEEAARPIPKDDEVLIEVRAASVNAADCRLMRGKPFLLRLMGFGLLGPKNKVLGADVAGRVEAVGGSDGGSSRAMRYSVIYPRAAGGLRRICLRPRGRVAVKAGRPELRAGGCRAHGGSHRLARSSRSRTDSSEAKCPDQWRIRRRGYLRGADRQSRNSDPRSPPSAVRGNWTWCALWGGPCHRLHAGGFH